MPGVGGRRRTSESWVVGSVIKVLTFCKKQNKGKLEEQDNEIPWTRAFLKKMESLDLGWRLNAT